MAVQNQHPAQLVVASLPNQDTEANPRGAVTTRWSNSYTSLFLAGGRPGTGDTWEMDGEYWRTAVGARVGLGYGLELDFELPFGHASGGFLDDFIIDWHDFFGFDDQGRDVAPRDAFSIQARRNGNVGFSVEEDGFHLLDVPIELAWSFVEPTSEQPFGGAARVVVEFPTGNDDKGFGNGETDVALGLVGEWRHGFTAVTAHAEHAFAGQPDRARQAGLEFRDVTSAGVGLETPLWWEGWSVLAQVEWETSTLRALSFGRIAHDHWNLWTGVRVDLGSRADLELALAEDLGGYISPDFSIWMTLHYRFWSDESPSR